LAHETDQAAVSTREDWIVGALVCLPAVAPDGDDPLTAVGPVESVAVGVAIDESQGAILRLISQSEGWPAGGRPNEFVCELDASLVKQSGGAIIRGVGITVGIEITGEQITAAVTVSRNQVECRRDERDQSSIYGEAGDGAGIAVEKALSLSKSHASVRAIETILIRIAINQDNFNGAPTAVCVGLVGDVAACAGNLGEYRTVFTREAFVVLAYEGEREIGAIKAVAVGVAISDEYLLIKVR